MTRRALLPCAFLLFLLGTTDTGGAPTRSLANPGSVLAFTYDGRP